MLGTLINFAAVIVGSVIGVLMGNRLPEKMQTTVIHGLGLMTIVIGMQMALQSQNLLIVLGSVLLGGLLGEWWRIEERLEQLGQWLEVKMEGKIPNPGGRSITRAFVTTTLIYCIGPLAIVGAILDGLTGNYQPLAIKSMLDGFASLAFGASLGPGVFFSAFSVLIYQGSISLAAQLFGSSLGSITAETPAIIELTATGGVLIMGIGLILLELRRIRVGNFLPAVAIAPLLVVVLQTFGWF